MASTDFIQTPTPHQNINNLLETWVEGVKTITYGNLVGIYLTGSLTYGDFVPDRSDLDLVVVVQKPLPQNELDLIKTLHMKVEEQYPEWKERIECSYLPLNLIHEILPPKVPRPWWGFGVLYVDAPYGNEWIINQYFLYNHGIALFGPEFKTLTNPVDMATVQKASARDLFKEWEPKINDPEWLGNDHNQSYLVLNLCRILYTVIQSKAGSKKVAATWTKSTYPEWKNLIEQAESWQYGMEMKRSDDAIAFIKFAIEKVNETGLLS